MNRRLIQFRRQREPLPLQKDVFLHRNGIIEKPHTLSVVLNVVLREEFGQRVRLGSFGGV